MSNISISTSIMESNHYMINECLASISSLDSSSSTTISHTELLNCVITKLAKSDENLAFALDFVFLLFSTSLVFFMQAGFAMLCAGSVRIKNVRNTMLKNLLDACGAAIGFWTFGYAFAYSSSKDGGISFIGRENYLLHGLDPNLYHFWLFQFAFAATSATIVAGTLAERCQMVAYMGYSLVLTGFVYPVIVRAIWSDYGFLNRNNSGFLGEETGMIDFAGSGVVHVTGGLTALLATIFLGPRKGRFHDIRGNKLEVPRPFPGHSAALQVVGTFILWFGWYGFNCGSIITLSHSPGSTISNAVISSMAALNTTLSASGGCCTALFTKLYRVERRTGEATFDLLTALNGTLAGLVAITAGCSIVDPWAALLIGVISGWIYLWSSAFLINKCIDDAVDAIPVHLANGLWGCLAVGLFAKPIHLQNLYGSGANAGCFYEWVQGSANFRLLAGQLIGLLFITVWVAIIMCPFFFFLNYVGWFRADRLEEVVGLDVSYHGDMTSITEAETVKEESYEAYNTWKQERKRNGSWHGKSSNSLGSESSAHSLDPHHPSFSLGPRNKAKHKDSGGISLPIELHVPPHPDAAPLHPVLSIAMQNRKRKAQGTNHLNEQHPPLEISGTEDNTERYLQLNIPEQLSTRSRSLDDLKEAHPKETVKREQPDDDDLVVIANKTPAEDQMDYDKEEEIDEEIRMIIGKEKSDIPKAIDVAIDLTKSD